jgi:hypothetical protein
MRTTRSTPCASCGVNTPDDLGLCPHHHVEGGHDWALANRIMCDFFHRRKVPRRLTEAERHDDTVGPERYIILQIFAYPRRD